MKWLSFIKEWLGFKFTRVHIASVCGHQVAKTTKVDVFGEKITFNLDPEKVKNLEHCPDCLAKMSVKCVKCQQSIVVGDPIVLYVPLKADFQIPEYAGIHEEEGKQKLVGCLRWECAESGMFRAGFWTAPGKVKRVASPLEIMMATDSVVACEDVSDPTKAVSLPKTNS